MMKRFSAVTFVIALVVCTTFCSCKADPKKSPKTIVQPTSDVTPPLPPVPPEKSVTRPTAHRLAPSDFKVEREKFELKLPMVKPVARQVVIKFSLADLEAYKEVARAVAFRPEDLIEKDFKACLVRHGYPEYRPEEVHEYLVSLSKQVPAFYVWLPLRKQDTASASLPGGWNGEGGFWAHDEHHGVIERHRVYSALVPRDVLVMVKTIASEVPEAVFYVSDIIHAAKHPFLAVGVKGRPLTVIAAWDEPDFKGTPQKRFPAASSK